MFIMPATLTLLCSALICTAAASAAGAVGLGEACITLQGVQIGMLAQGAQTAAGGTLTSRVEHTGKVRFNGLQGAEVKRMCKELNLQLGGSLPTRMKAD